MGRRYMRTHVAQAVQSSLRRRMALAEVDTRVSVVVAWLLDSSGSRCVGVLIDGRLHLLQELINVHQIILGSQVWQWQGVLVLWHWTTMASVVTIDSNHGWSMHVV